MLFVIKEKIILNNLWKFINEIFLRKEIFYTQFFQSASTIYMKFIPVILSNYMKNLKKYKIQ